MMTTGRRTHNPNPTLEMLQQFCNGYFKKNPPTVKRHLFEEDGIAGYADFTHNCIQLAPTIAVDRDFCHVGGEFSILYDEKLNLQPGDQYFLVLLHEIAHFKITKNSRVRIPADYKVLKQILDRKLTYRPGEREYIIKEFFNKKYQDEYLVGAIQDFTTWYKTGDFLDHHATVDQWARREFKKRRTEIHLLLRR